MIEKVIAGALATTLMVVGPALAAYPDKPVRIIVPFVPGGSSDITARTIAPGMEKVLGQTVIVENKPGANGAIAAQALKNAKPDGYTLMVGSIGTFAINEGLYKNLSYNPSEDFDYVSQLVRNPNVLVVSSKIPVKTVAELIEYAGKHPGQLSYASSGTGSSDHLSAAMFRQRSNTTGIDVPYKGGGAAIADLLGAQVDVSFQNLGAVLTHVQSGKLKALAITGEQRSPELPDTPTMAESGIKNMVVYSWQGVAAPKGTPKEIVDKLHQAVSESLKQPRVQETMKKLGFTVVGNNPDQFSKFQQEEVSKWKEVIKSAGLSQ
ncbi:tripartite-type tricarboxylate transporter receptor subunit TctC [Advenella incenata]|jgi:tripartite-type tricarboxylate transporter receptor subunit TctC|uniref:Tripartite-type tricarboxylate transporter receptor subunit TctC n=1 Tax=Advenella incenata TaxID=267800 RepID=A0A4Q7V919_9BURK|nr:tripartite tricarboxylate transporter substrate binding protein [Advenella incenata]RZT92955.1 tripartite-type tricarboxylate transporter receptor subunit TctC [Advenella incenata]